MVEDVFQPMYNLTVDEAHTFFIGGGDWLVHNATYNCTVDEVLKDFHEKQTYFSARGETFHVRKDIVLKVKRLLPVYPHNWDRRVVYASKRHIPGVVIYEPQQS